MSAPTPRHAAAVWADNSNITRTRIVPTHRLVADANFQVTLTNAVQGRAAMGDAPFESPVGEVYLVPEPTRTLYPIGRWMEDCGAFFGDMRLDNGDGEWTHCPRSFLGRQLKRLREEFQLAPTVGFELEFQLVDPKTLSPIDSALYCSMKAFHDGRAWRVLKQIVECLEDDLGIPVHQYHAESAHGQLEISIGTFGLDANTTDTNTDAIVRAVDKLVLTRQTIYATAAQAGLQATFVPKLRIGQAGNAAHMHIGLLDLSAPTPRSNLFKTNSSRATSFLAGILDALPSMCMLLAPTVNSYDRLQPKCWAGAYQCYGYENREAPLRLVGPTTARTDFSLANHFEVKTMDGTANPHLTLGSILVAGMNGMENKLVLPPACGVDPASLEESERPGRLPQSLDEAIVSFKSRGEDLWRHVLSPSYANLLVTLRSAELAHYEHLTREEMVKQLVQRY